MTRQSEAAADYAARGWRVVPLHHPISAGVCSCRLGSQCDDPGKHPRISNWQNEATTDAAVVERWWARWPNANVGVQLGETSGLIDIECDSPEAEQELLRVFERAAEESQDQVSGFPITPSYRSRRGVHRLFRWRAGFPFQSNFHAFGIEVRVGNGNRHGTQSVFPGSYHGETGLPIDWLISPDECDPAEISDAVLGILVLEFNRQRIGETQAGLRSTGETQNPQASPTSGRGVVGEFREHIRRIQPDPVERSQSQPDEFALAFLEGLTGSAGEEAIQQGNARLESSEPQGSAQNSSQTDSQNPGQPNVIPLWREMTGAQVMQGGRDAMLFRMACSQARRFQMAYGGEVFDDPDYCEELRDIVRALNLLKCVPPLEDEVAIAKANQAIGYIRSEAESNLDGQLRGDYVSLGLEWTDGEWWPGRWRLQITDADDPEYLLHVPWANRALIMNGEEFHSPAAVALKAAKFQKTLSPIPKVWSAVWRGKPPSKDKAGTAGVCAKLLAASERVRSVPEQDITIVMGEAILSMMGQATTLQNRTLPDIAGRMYVRGLDAGPSQGAVIFRFETLLQEMSAIEGVTRHKLSRLLTDLGVDRWRPGRGGAGGVWRELSPDAIQRLKTLCNWQRLRVVDTEQERTG